MKKHAIAIHGGAGTILKSNMTPEKEAEYRKALESAVIKGEQILSGNGTALDAVEAAVKFLENDELFNAGRGSVLCNDGTVEMDASIMDGKTLMAGAAAAIKNVKNPISLARAIMERTDYVFLSGAGANEFARKMMLEMESDEYFITAHRYEQLLIIREGDKIVLDHNAESQLNDIKKFGTVGAVAFDNFGNLAAATSTGGMTNKTFGRIGDSPVIGAGTYANNETCAVSCTGHGEYFLRAVVGYDVSCLMEYKGLSLKEACEIVVKEKLVKLGGEGGLVAVDHNGHVEMVFNSEGMYRAMQKANESPIVHIYKD